MIFVTNSYVNLYATKIENLAMKSITALSSLVPFFKECY